jgi:hypothetical protein
MTSPTVIADAGQIIPARGLGIMSAGKVIATG